MDLLSTLLRNPVAEDDKYSRGVVGFVTGSTSFPGAAILGVTAAMRTGVGSIGKGSKSASMPDPRLGNIAAHVCLP